MLKTNSGFTLIEIMVVVMIIGLLASVVSVAIGGNPLIAQKKRVVADFSAMSTALKMYRLDNGLYPTAEQGLEALTTKPSIFPLAKHWRKGGYLDRLPIDPWDHPYQYYYNEKDERFEIISYGADNAPGSEGASQDLSNLETP